VVRIAIVDDHPVVRWGIEHVFRPHQDFEVICSTDSLAALDAAGVDPDVVILDLYLDPGRPALDAVQALSGRCRVLVISASGRPGDVVAAIRAGADGYLTKHADDDAFFTSVEQVARGNFYLSSHLADMLHAELERAGPSGATGEDPPLAPREEETLRYIAQGFTHAQTARRMGVSQATVETYVKRIRRKLNLGNKADLTRKAIELDQLDQAQWQVAGSPDSR
jgi:DNA-binding NarL/FixJ family response regulator